MSLNIQKLFMLLQTSENSNNKIVSVQKKWYSECNNGYVALITVLALGAAGIALTFSMIMLGLSFSRTSSSFENAEQAKGMANACAEVGLAQLQQDTNYTGTSTVTIGSDTCSYTVSDTGGQTRSVVAASSVDGVTRRVSVLISDISSKLVVSQWQEVSN